MSACVLFFPKRFGVRLELVDLATYVTALSAILTVIALICSLSIAWVLYSVQQTRGERIATFDRWKDRLLATQEWLFSQPASKHRDLCLACIIRWDRYRLGDLPRTDFGEEYNEYCNALEAGLASSDDGERQFFSRSANHLAYLEELMSRIGTNAVAQIIAGSFLATLGKGAVLVVGCTVTLFCSLVWFSESTAAMFLLLLATSGIGAALLLLEVCIDLQRDYEEETQFPSWEFRETTE